MQSRIAVPTKSGLPPAQHSFCHFLVADPKQDPTQAYLKVVPDAKKTTAQQQAWRYMKKPEVREYLQVLMEERQKRLEIDEDWVIMRLRDIHDWCTQADVVTTWKTVDEETGETEQVPVYAKFDATGALKALELIGKHMKMFSDKVDGNALHMSMELNFSGDQQPAIEGTFTRDAKT